MRILTVFLSVLISAFSRVPASAEINDSELPQSAVYDIVMTHLSDTASDKDKKVLLIGYDGFRRDCLPFIMSNDDGAVSRVASQGSLIMTYAGGTVESPQQTSTAAGWSSILTGKAAAESGVWNNKSVKRDSAETFLTSASKMGYSCAFISSYTSHFDSTLIRDIRIAKRNGISCEYILTADDEESKNTALSLIESGNCDVVFVIFEYTDDAGHSDGFSPDEAEYEDACSAADRAGAELIGAAEKADGENTDRLIVITTDHGGIGRRHGGQSKGERSTWAAVNRVIPYVKRTDT